MKFPVPAKRSHIRVTEHGGYNFSCECGGSGWSQRIMEGHRCRRHDPAKNGMCGQLVTWREAPKPHVTTGWVVGVKTATTGNPIVYLNPKPRGRMGINAEPIPWVDRVLNVEYIDPS